MAQLGHHDAGEAFRTERLTVGEWHRTAGAFRVDLVEVVQRVLTPSTTAFLPPRWRGGYDRERALTWIDEVGRDSLAKLVIETASGVAVGLVILHESQGHMGVDLRVGSVLAEAVWGRGYGSELVRGMVDWAENCTHADSITGGVAQGNDASARVLEKAGFERIDDSGEEVIYQIVLGMQA